MRLISPHQIRKGLSAIHRIDNSSWSCFSDDIMQIETSLFGKWILPKCDFEMKIRDPRNVNLVALVDGEVAGYCISSALENCQDVRGVQDDPRLGYDDVLYTDTLGVSKDFQGFGLGKALKCHQMMAATLMGYHYIAGRNRVNQAERMWQLNQSVGAQQVKLIKDAYDEEPKACIYYHIDLRLSTVNKTSLKLSPEEFDNVTA